MKPRRNRRLAPGPHPCLLAAARAAVVGGNLALALRLPAQSTAPPPPTAWSDLSPMVVTATRHAEPSAALPFMVDVVGAADFARTLPRTTPDALGDLPSVMVQKTAHAQGSPFIRGFTGFRTLMLVDGIRLNNSTFRDGPNQYWGTVDPLSLERLEVVRGPASVLYGSDAIGGTVNALTRGRSRFGENADADAHLFYRYASAEDSHTGRVEASGNEGDRVGIAAGFSYKSFGNLRAGDEIGVQPHTGYTEWDADAKIQYLIAPQARLVFGHQTVDQDDAWRTHGTIYGIPWRGTVPGSDLSRVLDQFRNLDYLQYEAGALGGWVDQVQAGVSYQHQDEDENRLRGDGRREVQGTYVDTLGLSVQLQSPSPAGRWTYGGEYYHDWVDSHYRRYAGDGTLQLQRAQGPVADDSGYDLFGAYAQNELPLLDERIELILGARYNLASASVGTAVAPGTGAPLSFEDSWNTVVGSGRALWHVDDARRWALFGGASQGFRAPNLSDLSRFDIADRGEIEVPVFDLEPEDFLSFEGGVRTRWGRVTAEAAYHHTLIRDMIVRYRTGETAPTGEAVVTKRNSGDGNIHGIELAAAIDLAEEWRLWGNFTWMEGTLETPVGPDTPLQVEPVSRLMPATVNFGLRWERAAGRYWAEFAGTIAATQSRLSTADRHDTQRIPPGGTPGYQVFHFRAGWKPSDHLGLSAALENLTDVTYRVHGSGLNEPGLNLIVAADVRF